MLLACAAVLPAAAACARHAGWRRLHWLRRLPGVGGAGNGNSAGMRLVGETPKTAVAGVLLPMAARTGSPLLLALIVRIAPRGWSKPARSII